MKSWIILLAVVAAVFIAASIPEQKSYDEAYQSALENDKRLMVIFTTRACVPCEELKRAIKEFPEIAYTAGTYEVLFYKVGDVRDLPLPVQKIMRDMGINRYPTTVSIDPKDEKYVSKFVGFDRQKWRQAFAY